MAESSAQIFSTNFQRKFSAKFSARFSAPISAPRDSYTLHKSTGLPSAWALPIGFSNAPWHVGPRLEVKLSGSGNLSARPTASASTHYKLSEISGEDVL